MYEQFQRKNSEPTDDISDVIKVSPGGRSSQSFNLPVDLREGLKKTGMLTLAGLDDDDDDQQGRQFLIPPQSVVHSGGK